MHGHGDLGPIGFRCVLLSVGPGPLAADQAGVHATDPGVPGLAERDPTADELAREESVSVQFHVDLRTVAGRTEADWQRVRPDARPVVEHEEHGATWCVG